MTKLVIVPDFSSVSFKIWRICLPVEIQKDRDISWLSQYHSEVISYLNDEKLNDQLRKTFPNLTVAKGEYIYDPNDTIIVFAEKQIIIIYQGLHSC